MTAIPNDERKLAAMGAQLQRLREKRGLTQKALAVLAKVHEVTVAKYESGDGWGSVLIAIALADALKVPLDQLVGRRDAPSPVQMERDAPQWFVRTEVLDALEKARASKKWDGVKKYFGAGFGWGLVLRPSAMEVTDKQYEKKSADADDYINAVPESLLRAWFEEEMSNANRRSESRKKP